MNGKLKFDYSVIIPALTILGLGLITLNSALAHNPRLFYLQTAWVGLGLIAFFSAAFSDIRMWERMAIPLYASNIILLALVLFIGKEIGGAQRWLDLGFMNFQVSELTKISIILFIAHRLSMKPTLEDGYNLFDVFPEAVATFISMGLIYKEPDLGSSLLVGSIALIMIMSSKINKKWLLGAFVFLIISAPLAWSFVLKEYQKKRIVAIVTMISSDGSDLSQTSLYHTNQSIIAIGSGQRTGKGYKKGTQNILRFIPEHHTDFIFSVYAEEFGFAGVLILLLLYLFLLIRILNIIPRVKEKFSALVLVGASALLWIHILINIGMVTGILPVVGIPLPLFSYGGSSMVLISIIIGLVHNISVNNRYI
jgi:rod shape determining protein RodA